MYQLMNKNTVLADFEISVFSGLETARLICKYHELPKWIRSLNDWLSNRNALTHRRKLKKLFNDNNINNTDTFIRMTHCLSLNDTLWVKAKEEEISWEDVSLYRNKFSDVISRAMFSYGYSDISMSLTIPEATTDGTFDKCWSRRDGAVYLIKAGTSIEDVGEKYADLCGREPYCEALASEIFKILCDGVTYNLSSFNGRVVTECELFTNEKYGYVSYADFYGQSKQLVDLVYEYNDLGANKIFCGMLLADCVTINPDRHFGNFGFTVDNDTFDIISINKPFDYNLAFFPRATWDNGLDDLLRYQRQSHFSHRLGFLYEDIAKALVNDYWRAELINLKDLILSCECDNTFTEERLDIVNRFKNKQIDMLLGNPVQFYFIDIREKYKQNKQSVSSLLKEAEGNK